MAADFYSEWLKVPPGPRPPDYYALLGVNVFCCDLDVIEQAARIGAAMPAPSSGASGKRSARARTRPLQSKTSTDTLAARLNALRRSSSASVCMYCPRLSTAGPYGDGHSKYRIFCVVRTSGRGPRPGRRVRDDKRIMPHIVACPPEIPTVLLLPHRGGLHRFDDGWMNCCVLGYEPLAHGRREEKLVYGSFCMR